MGQPTMYAKKVPTRDDIAIAHLSGTQLAKLKDVALFQDASLTKSATTIPWHYKGKPTRRNKSVTINCTNYKLQWVD